METINVINLVEKSSLIHLQLYHFVLSPRGYTGAIGRPVHAKDFIRMSRQLLCQLLGLHTPNYRGEWED